MQDAVEVMQFANTGQSCQNLVNINQMSCFDFRDFITVTKNY